MADFFAVQALDSFPAVDQAQAGEVGVAYGSFSLTATLPAVFADGDVIHMCWLPALHRILDAWVWMDAIDGVADLTWNGGISDDPVGATEDEDALIVASTIGQTAGRAIYDAAAIGVTIPTVNNRRRLGITMTTNPATQVAGNILMAVTHRSEDSRDTA